MMRKKIFKSALAVLLVSLCWLTGGNSNICSAINPVKVPGLTKKWDKTFPKSAKVKHRKVTFRNRYGISLAADLYVPAGAQDHTR